jgi:non-heme chloroperoxidase
MVFWTCLSVIVLPIISLLAPLLAQKSPAWRDRSPHRVQFVTVDKDVRLEVLDWGGSGRAIVFLAGLSHTAHIFDDFAPKFTAGYHVYGITRRGFGASSIPDSGYDADRLADDVLEVLDSLKLIRPVLAGHSIAGEELSSIGSRHPERVAGLIYLDAAYPFAFVGGKGMTLDDMKELMKIVPDPPEPSAPERASFAAYQARMRWLYGATIPESQLRQEFLSAPDGSVGDPRTPPRVEEACLAGQRKFTDIRAPALAICADPQEWPWGENNKDPAVRAGFHAMVAFKEAFTNAFEKGVPNARVVRLRGTHLIFLSNEADVLREMKAFLATLK